MTFIVCGGSIAAAVGATTALEIGAVTAATAAVGGAALGAGTAALTGQDVGKGALMGGVGGAVTGGLGAGLSAGAAGAMGAGAATNTAVNSGIGAIAGAAGGAAGAAAGGQNAGSAAMMGGLAGGLTGAMRTPSNTEVADANLVKASNAASEADKNLGTFKNPGDIALDTAAQDNLAQAANAASNATNAPPNMLEKGINAIKDNPKIAMIGGGALMAAAGRTQGNSQMPSNLNTAPSIGKSNISPDFQRYVPAPRAANYAAGGIAQAAPFTPPTPQMPDPTQDPKPVPVNPFYVKGMQLAQQTQQQAQLPQVGDQVPQAPTAQLPQGIVQPVQTAASGGLMGSPSLGSYAHGGISRLLRGPGDGVSDDIPAEIEGRQPARLADGEFVVPARIVSELGNGSTEAGGKALQAMVDRVQSRRAKTTGKGKFATNSKAIKELPV